MANLLVRRSDLRCSSFRGAPTPNDGRNGIVANANANAHLAYSFRRKGVRALFGALCGDVHAEGEVS
jgi:hypothetical protein